MDHFLVIHCKRNRTSNRRGELQPGTRYRRLRRECPVSVTQAAGKNIREKLEILNEGVIPQHLKEGRRYISLP
jgi:hypothetical protein